MGGHQKSRALFQNLASCKRGPHHKNVPDVKSFPKNTFFENFLKQALHVSFAKKVFPQCIVSKFQDGRKKSSLTFLHLYISNIVSLIQPQGKLNFIQIDSVLKSID